MTHVPVIDLPDNLSDQAVAQTVEVLYDIARALENHYAGQLHHTTSPSMSNSKTSGPTTTTTPRSEHREYLAAQATVALRALNKREKHTLK